MTDQELKELRERDRWEGIELKRQNAIRKRVIFFDSLATEPMDGHCFGCPKRPLPAQAYCKRCLEDILSLTCTGCGQRLYRFVIYDRKGIESDVVLGTRDGRLEEDTPDGEFCYRCTNRFGS
jgi:hypothetical protein